VARDFPELRILLSHGGYTWVNETIGVCMRHRNVYIDFSCVDNKPMSECYAKAANEYITDKVPFLQRLPHRRRRRRHRTRYKKILLTPKP
jgi:predicted TIM-barrel fold metal-dependent hydrolase